MVYLTLRQAAQRRGCARQWIAELVRAGRIEGCIRDPVSGWWLIPEDWKAAPPKKAEKEEIKEKQNQQSKLSA